MKKSNTSLGLSRNRYREPEYICGILLLLSLMLKLLYAAQVTYSYSPHDLGTINVDGTISRYGHLSYIQYLYLYRSIPDTYAGQFYHPPLFHMIGAVVLAIHHVTDNYDVAFESLQMINMLLASAGILYGYLILKKIAKKDWSLVIGTSFLCFCP